MGTLRIRVLLNSLSSKSLTVNYNYPLASAIYNLLRLGSSEFSAFLHDIGFPLNGRKYKLFTFALRFEKISIEGKNIVLLSPDATLIISTPLIDDFIKNLVIGSFEQQFIKVNDVKFIIKFAEILPDRSFNECAKFQLLSPLVLSTRRIHNGKEHQYFIRPEEGNEINRILLLNLTNKYKLLYKKDITFPDKIGTGKDCELKWDEEYLRRKKRVTKKITIDENGIYPIDIIGIQAPFTLKTHPDLIKIGYECGFGEKNSMGFGLADIIA